MVTALYLEFCNTAIRSVVYLCFHAAEVHGMWNYAWIARCNVVCYRKCEETICVFPVSNQIIRFHHSLVRIIIPYMNPPSPKYWQTPLSSAVWQQLPPDAAATHSKDIPVPKLTYTPLCSHYLKVSRTTIKLRPLSTVQVNQLVSSDQIQSQKHNNKQFCLMSVRQKLIIIREMHYEHIINNFKHVLRRTKQISRIKLHKIKTLQ